MLTWTASEALYGDVPILPPDQYSSLVLLATDGCIYNQCTFCGFYRDVRYRMRNQAEQFREHVQNAVSYHGGGLTARRSIFLGQANALVGPRALARIAVGNHQRSFLNFRRPKSTSTRSSWWQGARTAISRHFILFGCVYRSTHLRRGIRCHAASAHAAFISGCGNWRPRLAVVVGQASNTPQGNVGHGQETSSRRDFTSALSYLLGAGGERFFDSHILSHCPASDRRWVWNKAITSTFRHWWKCSRRNIRVKPKPIKSNRYRPDRVAEQEQQIRAGLVMGARKDRPYLAKYDVSHFVY